MAKTTKSYERYVGGVADFEHESLIADAYSFARSVDIRTNPHHISILPRTIKESGTVIQNLPKWGEYVSSQTDTYIYDAVGNIYERTSAGSYSLLHTVPASHGNGLSYFAEDDFLYYTSDKLIGRYGNLSSTTPSFTDDFFGSQGGVPLNTASLDLEASSSQYAGRADTASLSITGSLSIEAQIYPESLPTGTDTMTLVSKWNEAGATRSYKFDIGTESNYFGDGSDGALTISSDTTEAPIDSACTGTSGAYTLTATNASFAADQIVLIHQSRGTNAGGWMRNKIQSYTAGTITLVDALNMTYSTGAQVRVLKQYTNVTINSGKTYTAKAWNGTVGGILAFLASGTVTVTGTITATGKGFRGASSPGTGAYLSGKQGESYLGTYNTAATANLYGGGGGGAGGSTGGGGSSAGGGAYAGVGSTYIYGAYTTTNGNGVLGSAGSTAGSSGATYGGQDLTANLLFGSGGGSGGNSYTDTSHGGYGGIGGGTVFIAGVTVTVSGLVVSNGNAGEIADLGHAAGGGGGGAGGSILVHCQTGTLGTSLLTASGGLPGYNTNGFQIPGGGGGVGRIHINYYTSYTGTSSPTLYETQDNNLGSSDGYVLRLAVSNDGTTTSTVSKPANLETAKWQHVGVSYEGATGITEFFLNGVSLGTVTSSVVAIHDNASVFRVGCNLDGAGAAENFYDGLIDEVRVWSATRSATDFLGGMISQINAASAGLQGYWSLNGDPNDSTANANNLTLTGSPVYSTNVPFPSPTSRLDIDQSATTTGSTYTLATTIAETATHRKTFTPSKDPQKSIAVSIVAVGTGNWTLTVHDQYNNVMATKTIANASVGTGMQEFVFTDVWRPLTNFTSSYHFHLTSTVADGTVLTTNSNDLTTVTYTTYYQFLVEDTSFHPIGKMLNFLVIGNERYIATYSATTYTPNKIVLPSGYHVRCFGYYNEYLVIGTVKGTSVTEQDSGRVYLWDGIASNYNSFIDIPEGGVNAVLGSKGQLHIWAGYQGDHLIYSGSIAEKIKRLPKITADKYVELYPQAVTMWKGLLRYGVAGDSDSTDINKGVYTYGAINVRYPDVLTFDYPISTGNYTGNNVKIGMLLPVDKKLLIGWADGTGYGVDYVDSSNDCYPTASIEFLIEDGGAGWKEKLANTVLATFDPLTTGQSIDVKYQLDEDGTWHSVGAETTVGKDLNRFPVPGSRYKHYQIAIDLTSSSGVSPTVKSVVAESDTLAEEKRV